MNKNVLKFAFTFDIDWASDAVLEYALDALVKQKLPITIFSTHNSKWLLEKTSDNTIIELEIHPNFCVNSSHGTNFKEVFEYCSILQTEKLGFRSHKYFDVNEVNEHYKAMGYKYSSNICTDLNYVQPFINRVGLLSIPIFMEDGGFLLQKHRLSLETILNKLPNNGTVVFLFHPMHLAFNCNNFETMKKLKNTISIDEYQNISEETIESKSYKYYGINNLFWELIDWSEKNGIEKVLLKSLINE
jgi:hypothetical protein